MSKLKIKPDLLLLASILVFLVLLLGHTSGPFIGVVGVLINTVIVLVHFWEERKTALDFVVSVKEKKATLKIANYGQRLYTVTQFCFRTESPPVRTEDVNVTVAQGDTDFDITESLTRAVRANWDDVEICFRHNSVRGLGQSRWKPFNVTAHDGFVNVSPGFEKPRAVTCPNCGAAGLFTPAGLDKLAQIEKRRQKVSRQLGTSCPDHSAKWLTTIVEGERLKRLSVKTDRVL
jgi:hypothetical protein